MEQPKSFQQKFFQQNNSQPIKATKIEQLEDPKNIRILTRKQIQKRLQNMKPGQYERVISNLTNQNKILQQQVKDLHSKVQQLMIAKKIPNPHHKNPLMEQEVKKAKKQLALKYESMNYLKQELKKMKQFQVTQDMIIKLKQQKNQIINAQIQIQRLRRQKSLLQIQVQGNSDQLQQYNPKAEVRDERINALRQDNKLMKVKIQQLNQNSKQTLKSSQQALDKYYNLKQQQQKFMRALIESKTSTKKLGMSSDSKPAVDSQVQALQKQVEQLRVKKKQAQKQLVNEKILKDQKKTKLQKQARQNIQHHKQLLRQRLKLLNQLNLYEAKDKKHRQIVENKKVQKEQKQVQQRGSQTDKIIPIDFRKQWIGNSNGISFDDSSILDYRSHVYIKALIIYKNSQFIGFVKFFYQNIQRKRYESKIPLDTNILRKYDSKKYTAKGPAYLKTFKLFLTNERITKIQFTWSDGEVIAEGYETQSSTKFNADIDSKQRPISMFGTVSFQGKNSYALESLGCEINKLEQQ